MPTYHATVEIVGDTPEEAWDDFLEEVYHDTEFDHPLPDYYDVKKVRETP